jgi:acylphosphatase
MVAVKYIFHGTVQGIGFRVHVRRKALELNLRGWVKNMPDGSVSAVFSGDQEMVSIMEAYCRKIPSSNITSVESRIIHDSKFNDFEIFRG